jgi:TonB family protein
MRERVFLAVAVSLLVTASSIAIAQNSAPVSENVLSLCQALEQVKTGDHQTLTVSAIYTSGAEDSFLYDPQCHAGEPSTWVEFAPKLKSRHKLERILEISSNRAYVQFEGEFFGPKPINPDTSLPEVIRKSGRHYGQLGGYKTMLRVDSIKQMEPVPNGVPFFQWPKESNASALPEATGGELPVVSHADVPLYPQMARIAHITGTVQVEVTIKNGVMANTEVKSSAPPMLVNATLENLKTWKFTPDANATFRITYIYEVEKEGTASPGNPRIEMQLPNLIKITAQPPKTTSNYQLGAVGSGTDTVEPATGNLRVTVPLVATTKPNH